MTRGRAARLLRRVLAVSLLAAAAGVARIPAQTFDMELWLRGYTLAWFFWLNIALGSLLLSMIHALTGGRWGECIRPSRKAASATLPLPALLSVPLLFGAPFIYPWDDASRLVSTNQAAYLGGFNVAARTLVYFGLWLAAAAMMRVWKPEDDTGRTGPRAAGGLILIVLTVTLFSVDWILSLQPESGSTMIGFTVIAGQLCGALALAIVITVVLDSPDKDVLNDLGNLLLASVLFFTYILYMEYLIVWSGNLPHEIHWYLERADGPGRMLLWGLIGFHIVLPACLLLSRKVKQSPRALILVAASVLLGRLFDTVWLLKPLYEHGGAAGLPADMFVFLLLAAAWFYTFGFFLNRRRDDVKGETGNGLAS